MKKTAYQSVSIVILAYNEEHNLTPTVEGIVRELGKLPGNCDYEIIIVEDGSVDGTPGVADGLSLKNRRIRVVHHSRNLGFGPTFRDGIKAASKETVIGFPGDNDTSPVLIADLVRHAGEADLIMSYPRRTDIRSVYREVISKCFVVAMNVLFRMHIRYYNGSFICKTSVLRSIPLNAKGFAIYAEAKVRLIRKGHSWKEIPFDHIGRKYGVSKAVSVKSVIHSLETMSDLLLTS